MKIEITNNKFNFRNKDLFEIGKRCNNKKRDFLFISKLLGKHLEVNPDICKATGHLLASIKYPELYSDDIIEFIKGEDINIKQELNKTINTANNVLVIGFAETATGLGMAVASKINNCIYQTTTREQVLNVDTLFNFEEEHSHATTHTFLKLLNYNLNDFDEIILVDDEITTGNSMLNLIKELKSRCNVTNYSVLSILDWRDIHQINKYKDFCVKNNLSINVYSILSGTIVNDQFNIYNDDCVLNNEKLTDVVDLTGEFSNITLNTKFGEKKYLKNTGRFGVKHHHILNIEKHAKAIAEQINDVVNPNENILVLGHGENIYIPSRIASYINANVKFKTTTRSPIYCDGEIIKDKKAFIVDNETYFFYNRKDAESNFDKVIMITENNFDVKLCNNMFVIEI